MKKVTMQDIAAELGISRNTVAKALNGGLVSPQTKQAVVQKAWQMGYAKLNQSLLEEVGAVHKVNTGTILVLLNHMQPSFQTRILTGISNAVNDEGYRMQFYVAGANDKDGGEAARLVSNDVKAVMFLGVFPLRFVKEINRKKLPMIFFNSPVNAREYIKLGDVMDIEGFYSMGSLMEYLIRQRGYTRFAYIGFAEGSRMIQARYLGFLNACSRNGIQPDDRLQYTHPADNISFSYENVEDIVNAMPYLPEAVICEDDDVAGYVSQAISKINPQAVRKLAITGFNNTLESDFFKNDIITVDVRIEELGRRLVKLAADKIKCPTMDSSFTTIASYPLLGRH